MVKKFLMLVLLLASFAALAPAAVVYGRGYGYARPAVRVGVYAAPGYYYGPRYYGGYVAPVYPAYGYGYGYGGYGYAYRGYARGYYGGGYYRGGGYARGGYARGRR
jgi:hypothetical protein